MRILRGDIYWADLSPVMGSEQGGTRPVLVVQNNTGNKHSSTVIVLPITTQFLHSDLPVHIRLDTEEYGLSKDSVVLSEQIRTIDKMRLKSKICRINKQVLEKVERALALSIGIAKNIEEAQQLLNRRDK